MSRTEQMISEILEENGCVCSVLNENMRLSEDLGLDSLRKVQVICDMEEQFRMELDLEDLKPENFKRVGDLFRIVKKYKGEWNEAMGVFEGVY